ncbi:Cytochrome c oxidase assembly protein COX11, mitochondrial [Cytospora mali]|uniref:Cytochrome c oxidase assembly protein COX11, mitochondrial n=1 Tax=Cytospora mali TaxID=578113 RepID=A0A194VT38_CYTMA|nr:Cytochrome c oxidase assembly protein COX11, mitochondrial [Valsa mali]
MTPPTLVPRKKVAIVGGGCAGIATLWALNRTHHDAYLYEAADRLGGHTNTVKWSRGKYSTMVDTGFIVMNTATYPNFINFLDKIKVPTVPTEMAFGVSRDHGIFEWAGTNLDSIYCQRKHLFSPRMWRILFDIVRFNQFALDLLIDDDTERDAPHLVNGKGSGVNGWRLCKAEETIGEYLKREGYSDAFRDDYLIPMTASVWSMSPDKCTMEFPAVTLVRFLWNHHLLSTTNTRPEWLTIRDGSRAYIDVVMKGFPPNHLLLKTPVRSITNDEDGRVRLHLQDGESEVYDHVILAIPGDEAYQIIKTSATVEENAVLSHFRACKTTAVLHSDLTDMPASRKAWSSCSHLAISSPLDQVSITYNVNSLQHIPRETFGDILVTLNPMHEPNPGTVQGRYEYAHPLCNADTVRAQAMLPRIQNRRGVSYAGAWTKYGTHEDAFSSGLKVAKDHLGARLPFEFADSTYLRGGVPVLGLVDHLVRLIILIIQVFLVVPLERVADQLSVSRKKAMGVVNGHLAWRLRSLATACMRPLEQHLPAAPRPSPPSWSFRGHVRSYASEANTRTTRPQQHGAPNMAQAREVYRRRNRTTMFYTLSIILGTVALSYGSVPMYKMICQTTGWGGQPVRAPSHGGGSGSDEDLASRLRPVEGAKRIRVTFNASVSDVLNWKFTPQQREVRVLPGETALAFYTATNNSDHDIIGVATYSVTPAQVAPYFSKIQCFCFEEQRLNAGETVDMPVFFYLDPDMLTDLNMKGVETVTLSYTFFKAKYDNNGHVTNFPTAK